MREILKRIIGLSPWPLTLNEKYDRQTKAVISKVCERNSNCIDIGCFKGEILKLMIRFAPEGRHIAFEPIPDEYQLLKNKFSDKADIYPFAIGNENKETIFNYVTSNPTYSGLKKRQYKREENVKEITIQVRPLDQVVLIDLPIQLIKIDVEGGEFDVLKGAVNTLARWRPYLIFEHGKGGSDVYGVQPGDVYDFLTNDLQYRICLMSDFLQNEQTKGFSKSAFTQQYEQELNCYFLAIGK